MTGPLCERRWNPGHAYKRLALDRNTDRRVTGGRPSIEDRSRWVGRGQSAEAGSLLTAPLFAALEKMRPSAERRGLERGNRVTRSPGRTGARSRGV